MNTELYNELIEAKANGSLQDTVNEKIASLNIESQDEFDAFCDLVNEKLASKAGASNLSKAIAIGAIGAIPSLLVGSRLVDKYKKESTYTKVMQQKPSLKNNEKRTKKHFDMLFHMAPNLMNNPTLAASMLEQLAQYDMIDHQMLSKIVDAEKSYNQSKQGSGAMGIVKNVGDTASAVNNLTRLASGF